MNQFSREPLAQLESRMLSIGETSTGEAISEYLNRLVAQAHLELELVPVDKVQAVQGRCAQLKSLLSVFNPQSRMGQFPQSGA